jgi:hypothetical protein
VLVFLPVLLFGGAFLVNAVPHFVNAMSGRSGLQGCAAA